MAAQTLLRNEVKAKVQEAIVKLGLKIPPETIPLLEEVVAKTLSGKVSPQEAMGITDDVMELMYQAAYNMLQNGKYKDALNILNVLRTLDVAESRYTFAIAVCYYGMKEYLDAAANYLIFRQIQPLNPIGSYRLYECYVKANYPSSALFYLQEALILASMDTKYAVIKEKIRLEAEQYNVFLKKYYQEKYGSAKDQKGVEQ